MVAQPLQDAREELLFRSHGGVSIALLWSRRTGQAVVAVHDETSGDRFELRVLETDNPVDVFDHPYAYAVSRRIVRVSAEAAVGV